MSSTEKNPAARLVLADGREYPGRSFGAPVSTTGEVVFSTGMVGYPESMTDPSYCGQILVFTYPLIGNYGVPARGAGEDGLPRAGEAPHIQVRGLVVSTIADDATHWSARSSLSEWMTEEGIVGIAGVDTRALTQHLRSAGTMPAKILVDGDSGTVTKDTPFENIDERNLVAEVSVREPVLYGKGKTRVVLVDCGAKANIVRSLLARGLSVLRVPWDHDFNREDAAGIVISNGPGDPVRAERTIANVKKALGGTRPVFGVCLGNQLVALAAGARTYKLRFGHRSQNQPCLMAETRRCYITSQNHGYAIDAGTLPADWEEWFTNANDGTNEGIRHRSRPFMTVQFHPEATPGPEDTGFLFDEFVEMLR